MKKILPCILTSICAAIFSFAYPPFNYWFIAWLGLVPILLILDSNKCFANKLINGFLAGFVFYAITLNWISSVAGAFYLFLAVYLGLFWAIFFWLLFSFPIELRVVIGSTIWYFSEIIIQHLFTGFPWIFVSLSQWTFPFTAKMAAIVGSAGLSALIILVNTSFYMAIKYKKFTQVLSSLIILFLLHGITEIMASPKSSLSSIKIYAVQGNVGHFGQDPEYTFCQYRNLTDSINEKCDLVIWPESSYPSILETESTSFQYLIEKSYNFPILMGTLREENGNIFNSAFLFNNGRVSKYDKNHLVPFGEYVPFVRLNPVRKLYGKVAGQIPELKAGRSAGIFNLNSHKFSVLICFENIFPYLAQNKLKHNPYFFVTITNDSWYGNSSGPYQHFSHNIFRAIETGRSVIQVSTTGITGFATPDGYFEMLEKDGQHLMIDGIIEFELPVKETGNSFYALIGETGISLLFLLLTGVYICRK